MLDRIIIRRMPWSDKLNGERYVRQMIYLFILSSQRFPNKSGTRLMDE